MSIIPIICYNYMANSHKCSEEDNSSSNNDTSFIPVGLSYERAVEINKYREAYLKSKNQHKTKIDEKQKGGVKL